MSCHDHIEITSIEIDNLVESTDVGVQVIVTRTGKPLWLPVEHIDFMPGRVIMPAWLARKIWGDNNAIKKGRAIPERAASLQAM